MSKDLKKEYSDMIRSDLPDLWDRISSALPEKEPVQITGKTNRTKIYRWTGLAAACICVAILVPVLISANRSAGKAASAQMAEVQEAFTERSIPNAEESYPAETKTTVKTVKAAAAAAPAAIAEEETENAAADAAAENSPEAAADVSVSAAETANAAPAAASSDEAAPIAGGAADVSEKAASAAGAAAASNTASSAAGSYEDAASEEAAAPEAYAAEEAAVPEPDAAAAPIEDEEEPLAAAAYDETNAAPEEPSAEPSPDKSAFDLGAEAPVILHSVSITITDVGQTSGGRPLYQATVLASDADGTLSRGDTITLMTDGDTNRTLAANLNAGISLRSVDLQVSTDADGNTVYLIR